ncbi:MAG: hypothetical protein ACRENP_27355 [Longimicrobiales bacterium]
MIESNAEALGHPSWPRPTTAPRLAVLDMAGTTVADAVPAVMEAAFARYGLHISAQAMADVRGRSTRASIQALLKSNVSGSFDAQLADGVYTAFQQLLQERLTTGVAPCQALPPRSPGCARVWAR